MLLAATALLATACSASDSGGAKLTTLTPDPTSEQPAPAASAGFTKTADLPYMAINGNELSMDVYQPDGEGPWPRERLPRLGCARRSAGYRATGTPVFTPSDKSTC